MLIIKYNKTEPPRAIFLQNYMDPVPIILGKTSPHPSSCVSTRVQPLPVNDWIGVKGTEKQHIRMSAKDRLAMKRLVGLIIFRFLSTTKATKKFPKIPRKKMRQYREERMIWKMTFSTSSCSFSDVNCKLQFI